jgi:hypothetical protein
MNRSIVFILLLLVAGWQAAMAQAISGKVVDQQGKALPYVNCVLRAAADSAYLSGAVTAADGTFSLAKPQADCTLHLSMMGYESKEIAHPSGDLGTITLPVDTMTLDEVVVEGETPLLSMENNKLTYNTEKILRKRNITTAHELLKELPSVTSLNGEDIDLVGAKATTVFISGKQRPMTLDYLKSLPADQVEKVEVIYNAPPEWHVDGAVLNVVLKKDDRYTLNGMVQAGYENQHANTYKGGGSLFASTPHWNYELIYKYTDGRSVSQDITESRHTLDGTLYDIHSETNGRNKWQGHSIFASVGRDVGKNGDITLSYTGRLNPKDKTVTIGQNSHFGNSTNTDDGHDYLHYVDLTYTNGNGTKAGVNYMNYYDRGLQALRVTAPDGLETSSLDYDASQRVSMWRGYADLNHSLGHGWTLYYGGSYTYTDTKNRQAQAGDLGDLEGENGESGLEEHNGDLYAGVQKSFWGGKLSLYASLKESYYKANDYKKNALLPTAQVTWVPSQSHIFQLSYVMMRNYPSYWQTRDFASYSDAYTRNEGNSGLRPSMIHSATLNYILMGKYVFQLNYYRNNSYMLYQGYQSDESLALIYKQQNINYGQLINLTATIPVSVCKWWDMNATLDVWWDNDKAYNWNGLYFNRHKWTGMAVLNNTLTLAKKPKLQANVMVFYRTPSRQGIIDMETNWAVNADLRMTFLKDRATLTLGCDDMFQTLYPKMHERLGNQNLDFIQDRYVNRSVSLTFSYKINGYKERSRQEVDTSRLGM